MLSAISKKIDALTKQQQEQSKQTKEVVKSQQFISNKHDELLAELKKYKDENKSLRNEVTSLTKKFSSLSVEVQQLEAQLNKNDQTKLSSNVLIRGIRDADDPVEAVKKIAEIIDFTAAVDDIVFARQVKSEGKDTVIVAVFNNEQTKCKFVRDSKVKRLSSKMYGEEKPIYVDEQLTKTTFLLFKHAKKLKKCGYPVQ